MNMHAIYGFIIGFAIGMLVNAYLLRGTPREAFLQDKKLRSRYGMLNWGIAILGLLIGLALKETGI